MVIGVGAELGLGTALCRRFASAGLHLLVVDLFDHAMAPANSREAPELIVHNARGNQRVDFRELSAGLFERFWRVGCFGSFVVRRDAARRLVPLSRRTVIFMVASASLQGKPGYAQFPAAKESF